MDRHVQVASPVRNRAWVLPEFLAALQRLDYPPALLTFYFLANDCADDSAEILRAWCAGRPGAALEEIATGVPGWSRQRLPRYDYANLANLRNRIVERFLQGEATHLFSVDSDVIVPPAALRQLLAADKPMIAGVISNLPGAPVESSPFHNFLFRRGALYAHSPTVPPDVFEVDVTGAVALIRRDLVEAGVRYAPHPWGEDVGFCEQARARGFRLWCHGGVRCEHRMIEPGPPPGASAAAPAGGRSGVVRGRLRPGPPG